MDLHTFAPSEVGDLLKDYLAECQKAGIFSIRVVHGKGTGVLKKRVWAALAKNALVDRFHEAPPEAGGWGATIVEIKKVSPDIRHT
ncbi:Smr protein/MutS2 [Desulfosudis oleivorans Hxd3]|uniref:Smr protein/MutS2 n=1 Tax=Desulfosudis oleivorans (strain DSM 6200 / JCM 39069 / Hxd3) TaxID=96561 RepID=A8ZT31_DESOH|nr:Smr protein/MutS2 [Desulfosudis oleivorans Hxd3]